MTRNYYVNEGNKIGGQEPQALGTANKRITASVAITKGQLVESTGNWTVGPTGAKSVKVLGVAFLDAEIGERVVIDTEGFLKLEISGTVAAGDKLVSAADGKVATKVDTGDIVGTAIAVEGTIAYVKLTL